MSGFLQREDSYALPQRQRHLTALILRKLLASSSLAIAATLDTLRDRLETLRDEQAQNDPELAERLIETEEIEDELLDEILGEELESRADRHSAHRSTEEAARRDRRTAAARDLGAQHRHRHQDADAAQGARHRLRADGHDGRGAQGADLHRVAPHAGVPQGVPGGQRLRGSGRALQRHQRWSGGHGDLRALGREEPGHRPRLRLARGGCRAPR